MANAQNSSVQDWASFLSRNDMVYDTLTTRWEDGVFTGNGSIGAMLYMADENSFRLEKGRTDVTDHRREKISHLYGKARLPIGHFMISPIGKILKNSARLHLWDAEATGELITTKGSIKWRTLTLSQSDIIVFETESSGNEKPNFRFVPEESVSSRVKYMSDVPEGYGPNPPFKLFERKNISFCRQPLLAGGDYTTAWKTNVSDKKEFLFITVQIEKQGSSVSKAEKQINTVSEKNIAGKIVQHCNWWHRFYPESFISIPDARMESFYWIQQYKMASATREGKIPIDLMGPWYRYTPWPAYWFNLNMQLIYSPMYAANRLSLAKGLLQMIDAAQNNLVLNVPEPYRHNTMALGRSGGLDMYSPVKVFKERDPSATDAQLELGNLTWLLHNYWLHYRYTMDPQIKKQLIPLLKQSINYYLQLVYKENDGKWHLPYSYSPEYPGGVTRDCNYDLSLLRWGCQTLLDLAPVDPLSSKWKDILKNLIDYPQDETGLRIGRDVAFNQSHRHYSHLLMIYPLYTMNWDQPENRALILKSLNHWHSFKGVLQGYSFTGGAAIYATMGEGQKAVDYLNQLLDRYVKSNTMYLETGPVIETPLAAAASIQDLLLQSWSGKIRVFPAIPDIWKDVAFENLRTEGAFLISASRKDGETQWVRIKSLAGQPCIINTGIKSILKTSSATTVIEPLENGFIRLHLKKNQEIILFKEGITHFKLRPVSCNNINQLHFWGKK